MTQSSCQDIRDELRGYRLGEGSPLQRTKMATHLEHCGGCRAELELHQELDRIAQLRPAPLTHAEKQQIFSGIRAEIGPELDSAKQRARFSGRSARWTTAAAALAASIIAVGAWYLNDPPPQPAQQANNTLQAETAAPGGDNTASADATAIHTNEAFAIGPGVVAYRNKRAIVSVSNDKVKPAVKLQAGTIVARYKRQPQQAPLVIDTPHAQVIIRGTVFAVHTSELETTVGVDKGKVEVRTKTGAATFLGAGQMLTITHSTSTSDALATRFESMMRAHFDSKPHTATLQTQGDKRAQRSLQPEAKASGHIQTQEDVTEHAGSLSRGLETSRHVAQNKPRHRAQKVSKPARQEIPTIRNRVLAQPSIRIPKASGASTWELISSARTLWREGNDHEAISALQSMTLAGRDNLSDEALDEAEYLLATIYRSQKNHERAAPILQRVANRNRGINSRLAKLDLARIAIHHLDAAESGIDLLARLSGHPSDDFIAEQSTFELCKALERQNSKADTTTCFSDFAVRFPTSRLSEKRNRDQAPHGPNNTEVP